MDLVSYTNYWGFFPCLLAAILVLLAKKSGSDSLGAALVGIVMIGLSALSIGMLTDVSNFISAIEGHPSISAADVKAGTTAANLWVLVIPAAIAGLGVNLISAWATK